LNTKASAAQWLRKQIQDKNFVMAPGAFDCVSARVLASAGFQAMYLTGHGVSNSTIGETDMGLLSFGEMLLRARDIIHSVDVPAIVDADTGYGAPINVRRTVRELESLGAAAIQIEDQTWPKKCGHMPGKQLIPASEMVQKLHAAVDARRNDVVIIARTDALAVEGYDAAIRRCKAYKEAGADVVFIDALGDVAECKRAAEDLNMPLMGNMVEGSRTAYLSADELKEAGFAISIWPITLLLAAITAMNRVAEDLKKYGTLREPLLHQNMQFPDFLQFWGFPQMQDLERKYAAL